MENAPQWSKVQTHDQTDHRPNQVKAFRPNTKQHSKPNRYGLSHVDPHPCAHHFPSLRLLTGIALPQVGILEP
jgi:hypothetical protein